MYKIVVVFATFWLSIDPTLCFSVSTIKVSPADARRRGQKQQTSTTDEGQSSWQKQHRRFMTVTDMEASTSSVSPFPTPVNETESFDRNPTIDSTSAASVSQQDEGEPSSASLLQAMRQVYQDLERPGPIYQEVTATLRFSYVPPPIHEQGNADGTTTTKSTWRNVRNAQPRSVNESSSGEISNKPLAVYIPGLDGYGISACLNQFDELATTFELWRLTVGRTDRSSFAQVVKAIQDFVQSHPNREITLIGESCGGVLASAAALRLQQQQSSKSSNLKGLVLVNPATSFQESPWEQLVPILTSLKQLEDDAANYDDASAELPLTPYSVVGSLVLASIVPDNDQIGRIVNAMAQDFNPLDSLDNLPGLLQQVMELSLDGFRETGYRLPPEVLEHRVLKWLSVGTPYVKSRLSQLKIPTLVVVGEQDKLLPSAKHADEFLLNALEPYGEKLSVRNRGHFVLDETVNLTEAIVYSKIDPLHRNTSDSSKRQKPYDPIRDWKLPLADLRKAIEKTVEPMRVAHSPVFFSTDKSGKRWKGLLKVPVRRDLEQSGPLLFVGNHQFAGADMRMFQAELFEQRGLFPRGLAHPLLFEMSKDRPGELQGRVPGIREFPNVFNSDFQQFGAVKVTPRNYYRLLQSGQDALLFPGGAKEAMSGRKDYPLRWPETKTDFVRTAARFNATIIPLSAVGLVDGVNVLAEPEDFMKIPFVGDRLKSFSDTVGAARYDERAEDEPVGLPLAVPGLPQRNYFLFGKPISLAHVDPNDKEQCHQVYLETKLQVRQGIDDLLRAREKDPFRDTRVRLAYERVLGKAAPTFPIDELN